MSVATESQSAINHFVDLCYQGRRGGCSEFERKSRELALLVLDNVPGMDGEAIEGLQRFIRFAATHPESARRVIG